MFLFINVCKEITDDSSFPPPRPVYLELIVSRRCSNSLLVAIKMMEHIGTTHRAEDVLSPHHLPQQPIGRRQKQCLLDVWTRMLLVGIWLCSPLTCHFLAQLFGIRKSAVAEDIDHVVPIIIIHYR